jgi:hypothetical protein
LQAVDTGWHGRQLGDAVAVCGRRYRLIERLLEVESRRAPFVVDKMEARRKVSIAGGEFERSLVGLVEQEQSLEGLEHKVIDPESDTVIETIEEDGTQWLVHESPAGRVQHKLLVSGTPEVVAADPQSATGQFLAPLFGTRILDSNDPDGRRTEHGSVVK